MSKPNGAVFNLDGTLRITTPSRVEDKIWDAVEEAIAAGWTPSRLIAEAADAWTQSLTQQARTDGREFQRIFDKARRP